jgi:hypothetical protein
MNEKIENPASAERRTGVASQGRAGWAVIIAFALGFGYAVVRGVVLLVSNVQNFGGDVSGIRWFVLIGAICVPALIFGACLVAAWRLPVWAKAVVFLTGSTVVAALTLSLYSLVVVVFFQG